MKVVGTILTFLGGCLTGSYLTNKKLRDGVNEKVTTGVKKVYDSVDRAIDKIASGKKSADKTTDANDDAKK